MTLPNGDNPWILLIEITVATAILGFLFFRRRGNDEAEGRGLQRVELKLLGGLQPSEVRLQAGRPTQLLIHRYDREPQDELFEIEDLGIYELLPALHTTVIAMEPPKRGRYPMVLGGENRAGIMIVE